MGPVGSVWFLCFFHFRLFVLRFFGFSPVFLFCLFMLQFSLFFNIFFGLFSSLYVGFVCFSPSFFFLIFLFVSYIVFHFGIVFSTHI